MTALTTQRQQVPALVENPELPWPVTSLGARLGGPAGYARWAIVAAVIGFVGWGAVVPLAGAAIAPGIVSPEGSRKAIQHLEGGIVRNILIKDGDRVEAGQVLIEMDSTQATAYASTLETQWFRLRAMRARLMAVQTNTESAEFDKDILDAAARDPNLAAFLENESRLLTAGLATKNRQDEIIVQQIQQSKEEIKGLEAVIKGLDRQLALIQHELDGLHELERKGLVRQQRVLELERAAAGLSGERSANQASIARAQQRISQLEVQRIAARNDFDSSQAKEILNTNSQLAEIEEKLTAARDVLARTKVTAPVGGLVAGLSVKAPGAIVRPGEVILYVVPNDVPMIIDARLSPNDIDVVHPGLMADIQITPYSQRYARRLQGKVIKVSADALVDEATRMHYFSVLISIDRDELQENAPEVELSPGMPAEVFIDTGHRTMLAYLFEPITRSMDHAFRDE
jgi:HlyD family type I secretion membrane fusion protein